METQLDNQLSFNVEKERQNCISKIKRNNWRFVLLTCVMMFLVVIVGIITIYMSDKPSLMLNTPFFFIAFLFMPVFFGLYLYMQTMDVFKVNVGSSIFIKYASHILTKQKSINCFDKLALDELVVALSEIRGLTYAQLKSKQKDLVHYAIVNEYYAVTWLFSKKTLEELAESNSIYNFSQIINNSDYTVTIQDKFVKKRILAGKKTK